VGDGVPEVASNICLRKSIEAWGRGRDRAYELVRKFVSGNACVARDPDKINFAVVEVQEELGMLRMCRIMVKFCVCIGSA